MYWKCSYTETTSEAIKHGESLKMQSCECALMLQVQRGQNESDCMSEHMHDMVTLERDPGPASLDTSACTTAQHSNKTHCPTSPIPTLLPMSTVTTPMYTFPHRFEVIFQVLPGYRVRQIAHIDSPSHLNLTPALCTTNTHSHDCRSIARTRSCTVRDAQLTLICKCPRGWGPSPVSSATHTELSCVCSVLDCCVPSKARLSISIHP